MQTTKRTNETKRNLWIFIGVLALALSSAGVATARGGHADGYYSVRPAYSVDVRVAPYGTRVDHHFEVGAFVAAIAGHRLAHAAYAPPAYVSRHRHHSKCGHHAPKWRARGHGHHGKHHFKRGHRGHHGRHGAHHRGPRGHGRH